MKEKNVQLIVKSVSELNFFIQNYFFLKSVWLNMIMDHRSRVGFQQRKDFFSLNYVSFNFPICISKLTERVLVG